MVSIYNCFWETTLTLPYPDLFHHRCLSHQVLAVWADAREYLIYHSTDEPNITCINIVNNISSPWLAAQKYMLHHVVYTSCQIFPPRPANSCNMPFGKYDILFIVTMILWKQLHKLLGKYSVYSWMSLLEHWPVLLCNRCKLISMTSQKWYNFYSLSPHVL